MTNRKPPPPPLTEEDFARANRAMEKRYRHLDEIAELFRRHFAQIAPLHEFQLMPQRDVNFRADIFFNTNADIEQCERDGRSQQMRDFIWDKLEEFGRGKRGEITVDFEFDSYENVVENYEGNYFLRMRAPAKNPRFPPKE